ncbi:MAG: FG-GAP repeat protein [Planctomycetota bacterium]
MRAGTHSTPHACFRRNGTKWAEEAKVEPSDGGGWYGHGVAVRGGKLAVGALFNDDSGSTYLYWWNGSAWTQQENLHHPELP